MELFPTHTEFLDFFQVEPTRADENVPWAYTRLNFSVVLGDDKLECLIDNPQLEIRWFRRDNELAFLSFCSVQQLRIQEYPGGKWLVAQGVGLKQELTFRLQLRPRIHISLMSSQ